MLGFLGLWFATSEGVVFGAFFVFCWVCYLRSVVVLLVFGVFFWGGGVGESGFGVKKLKIFFWFASFRGLSYKYFGGCYMVYKCVLLPLRAGFGVSAQ